MDENGWFIMEILTKMYDLGVPHLWKPPNETARITAEFGPGLPPRSSWQTESFRSEADESPYKDAEMSATSHLGLSENSVPLHPMVCLIIIPTKWL